HSIETNMPFAINHMAAIASAGVPPETAFRMLVEYGKYGEFSNEIKKIVKRMNTLGEDLNKSVVYVLKTTPSDKFREFLYGMVSVVEGGGNINQYLKQISAVAMFDYRMKRKKYLESLSTFGDIYTVILITAPLFIIALLTIMNLVPSATVGGMDIVTLMYITTYVMIPFLNLAFLVFLYIIQPEI
ncbi:MAG: type II secretion system F family protein, partial [Candidatus Aenigmarchaeota archaeon]|nr:type II secretion system F family protein [Candidatus Aenigmarchaeota archaeon]